MSTQNTTGLARISCDTRWQARSKPVDPRYVGTAAKEVKAKFGLTATDATAPASAAGIPAAEAVSVATAVAAEGGKEKQQAECTMEGKKIEWGFI